MRIDFTPRSLADIRSILQYVEETWGTGLADDYRDTLRKAFDLLTVYPDIGHRVSGKPDSHREFPLEHHVIR